jgi:ADP-heptose:LPS heptosyltransferase
MFGKIKFDFFITKYILQYCIDHSEAQGLICSADMQNIPGEINTNIKEIKKRIKRIKEDEYWVYIRMRHLSYFISITRRFVNSTYQIEYDKLKQLHPELQKELKNQYDDLHYYQDMLFFMC